MISSKRLQKYHLENDIFGALNEKEREKSIHAIYYRGNCSELLEYRE